MNKAVLKIYDDQLIGVNIAIDGKPIQECLPFETRLNALENANKKLDIDVLEILSAFKNDPFIVYACSITDDRYLTDTFLSGRKNNIIWYYYLIELIDIINTESSIEYISVDSCFISRKAVKFLQSKNFPIKSGFKYLSLSYLISSAYFLKHLKNLIFLFIGFFEKTPKFISNDKKTVLIDVPDKLGNHRYGSFLEKINDEYYSLYVDISNGILLKNGINFKILSVLTLGKIPNIIYELFGFKKSINNNKNKIGIYNYIFENIKAPNVFFFLRNLFLIASLKELFRKQKIDFVLISSAFNTNIKKIFILCAKELSIPCVCFLPRPLTISKPAERIIKCNDIDSSLYILPDFYQTNNFTSYEVLISQGISPKNIIFSERTIDRMPVSDKNVDIAHKFLYSIILLLGGKSSVNEKLIDVIVANQTEYEHVLISVRAHPLHPLTADQKERLSAHYQNWFDATKKPYSNVPAQYKLVISTSSTASVEAAKSGCGIVWCPYMEEESLLMYPIMRKFGHIVKSDNELIEFVGRLLQDEQTFRTFSADCEADAKIAFGTKNSINKGYQLLNTLVNDYRNK
jgi:hypothetical protein